MTKGYLQLLQLLVAEGGAVASPGWGGVNSAPPTEANGHGGLTQRPLPHRVADICFQEEENEFEALLSERRRLSSSCFLASSASYKKRRLQLVKEHFTNG